MSPAQPGGPDPARGEEMRAFWNDRAREDAFYFVDTRQTYRRPDAERFWAADQLVDHVLDGLGVGLHGHERVLEIGCGVGRITRVLAARAAEVVAIDVSDEMLRRAGELNPDLANVLWTLGDGVTLAAVADGSIDACLTLVVLQHVPDPEVTFGYVRELGRVLRPGGWAALQVSNDPAVHRPRTPLGWRLRALLGRAPRGQHHPAWLGSWVDLTALRSTARDAGLATERVWGEGSQYCQVLLRRPAGG